MHGTGSDPGSTLGKVGVGRLDDDVKMVTIQAMLATSPIPPRMPR